MPERRCAEILLVEDSPDDVELTLHALTKARVANKVTVARDGAEALDYLFGTGDTARPLLPGDPTGGPAGPQVAQGQRDRGPAPHPIRPATHAVPVIALTSSREDRDIAETYELGVNSYIAKPVDFDQFKDVVERLGYYWLVLNQPPPNGPRGNAVGAVPPL